MDTQPDLQQHENAPRHALNGLIFALMIFAVLLGAATGWMRYTKKRACGFQDAAEQAMGGLLPELTLAGGLTPGGGTPRFICPQCSSYCWTQSRVGCPLCPFCKQPMVQEVPGVAAAGGLTPVGGTAPIIPIQAGVKATHDQRGPCMNCHTVVKTVNTGLAPAIQSGVASPHRNRGACTTCHSVLMKDGRGPVPTIAADAVARHPDLGACANCHLITKLSTAAFTPAAAAPPIAANAVKPILLKPFGMEVSPAPGEGAKVTGVMGNSNASKAGLVAGDIVVECNGKKVADAEGLAKLITAAAPEANAQLKVVRNGRLQKVAVMVGEGEMEGFTPIPTPKP